MSDVEFVGTGLTCDASELRPPVGASVQPAYVRALAQAHESAGFDRVLIGETSSSAHAATVAGAVLAATATLGVLATVRDGFTAPTVAARELASLDAFFPGRIGAHLPAVADDLEPRRDGDWLDREGRQERRAEFAELLQRTGTSTRPFDHEGGHYRVRGAWSSVRTPASLPLYVSGASAASDALAAERADVYLLPTEPVEAVRERIAEVAAASGRHVRFGLRLRPILGDTAASASAYAARIARVLPGEAGSDRAALRAATGAIDGLDALVGTADQVAATLLRYVGLGVTVFHLAGFEPLADVTRYRELIAAVHASTSVILAAAGTRVEVAVLSSV